MENPHNGLISGTKLGPQGVHCSKEWDKAWVKIHDNILTQPTHGKSMHDDDDDDGAFYIPQRCL